MGARVVPGGENQAREKIQEIQESGARQISMADLASAGHNLSKALDHGSVKEGSVQCGKLGNLAAQFLEIDHAASMNALRAGGTELAEFQQTRDALKIDKASAEVKTKLQNKCGIGFR